MRIAGTICDCGYEDMKKKGNYHPNHLSSCLVFYQLSGTCEWYKGGFVNTCDECKQVLRLANTEHKDKEYFENASNITIDYISEHLLNMHADYHFKYLDHIRKSTHKLMEMYKN